MQIIDENYTGAAVYAIYNSIDNKIYVGSTMNYQNRIRAHVSQLKNNRHTCKKMQSDYNNNSSGWQLKPLKKADYPLKSELMNWECDFMSEMSKNHTLYNRFTATHNHMITKNQLLHLMADEYCKEHFDTSFNRFTENRTSDFIEMIYLSIKAKTKDERDKIQNKYNDRLKLRKAAKKMK